MSTELRAGMISFLMIAYILAVNPTILEVTGGTCDPQELCTKEVRKIFAFVADLCTQLKQSVFGAGVCTEGQILYVSEFRACCKRMLE